MLKYFLITNKQLHDINPRECGTEDCAPGYKAGPIAKEFYLLHYVFSGKGTLYVGGKSHEVSRGQIFVIRPHEIVTYIADEKDPWDYCWVGFDCNIPISGIFDSDIITLPAAEHIFLGLKACEKTLADKEYYICSKIYELISMLEQPVAHGRAKSYQNIMKAKEYIDANYVNPITVEMLADYLGINRSYFSTTFKSAVGKSPQQYLVDKRLNKAAELITTQGYSASAAALSSGYTDIFNFSKMFKRKFGLSPTAYAKANAGPKK